MLKLDNCRDCNTIAIKITNLLTTMEMKYQPRLKNEDNEIVKAKNNPYEQSIRN